MNKRDTKQVLIETGTDLFLARGYNNTGLHDILAAAEVPKGSFYHHFRSKEAFALAVVHQYGEGAQTYLETLLGDASRPPLARVRHFFEEVFSEFERQGCRHGCLLGNLGQELADAHNEIRSAIQGHLKRWSTAIAQCLDEAVAQGTLPADTDTQGLAQLFIDGFQGAALSMKLERNAAPLVRFIDHHFAHREAA